MGPMRPMPTHVCRRQNSCQCARRRRARDIARAREDREPGADAPVLACVVAAVVYVWQEQREYSFPRFQFAAFIVGILVLSVSLCLFQRGPSPIQPPEAIAGFLRFIGRHTLEIYAIQLAGFELLTKLVPDLAP